jgi:pyruvate dehydrogenase E2 component (dihydrolipoamide acetyltransferase)
MATETAIDVVMPQMGVSVSEGTVTKWLKREGEQVEADEPLLEISTDKVDTEVPSPGTGTLTRILVQEGETVEVGTKLAQIGGAPSQDGGEPAPAAPAGPPEPATQQAADASMAAASEGVGDVAPTPLPAAREPAEAATTNGKTFVSPVVARIASEHGVDPNQVQGTGRGGRVTKKDILDFIESRPSRRLLRLHPRRRPRRPRHRPPRPRLRPSPLRLPYRHRQPPRHRRRHRRRPPRPQARVRASSR